MRKLNNIYKVHYAIVGKTGNAIVSNLLAGTTCYREIYSRNFDKNNHFILSNFLCEETSQYSKNYLERLSKIFDIQITYINEDKIRVIGFKNKLQIKIFLSMFRLLFEIIGGYTKAEIKKHKDNSIKFFKEYTDNKFECPYKKELSRYIYFYNKHNIYQGTGHGLSKSKTSGIRMVSKKDILSAGEYMDNQTFFKTI
jgi:hypothetical protein